MQENEKEGKVSVETGYGQIEVPRWQFDLWNRHGQPPDDVLHRMAIAQREYGDANYDAR